MDIDPTLPLPRTLQMHAGTQVVLSTRCMASAGMPLQIAGALNLDVDIGRLEERDTTDIQSLEIGAFPVVALRVHAKDVGPGSVDLTWSRPWEGPDSASGFRHSIQVQVHPIGTELPLMARQIADQISAAPPATKAEVSAFLDGVDGRRPYGARKVSAAQMVLDQVAQSLAIHQALACTRHLPHLTLSDLVSDPALVLLATMGFDRFRLRDALDAFIKGR